MESPQGTAPAPKIPALCRCLWGAAVPSPTPHPSAHTWEPICREEPAPAAPTPTRPAALLLTWQPGPSELRAIPVSRPAQIPTHRSPQSPGTPTSRHHWQREPVTGPCTKGGVSRGFMPPISLYLAIIPGAHHTRITQASGQMTHLRREEKAISPRDL